MLRDGAAEAEPLGPSEGVDVDDAVAAATERDTEGENVGDAVVEAEEDTDVQALDEREMVPLRE